jgi:hypothetical protein
MTDAPQSGTFLGAADEDVLSAAVLNHHGQWVHSLYHGVQSIEKYLKARFFTLHEAAGRRGYAAYNQHEQMLRTHNIPKLYAAIKNIDKTGLDFPWESELPALSEFDQATRYPYVERKVRNGMCSSDIELCYLFALHVRPAAVSANDNYPLAMAIRGYRLDSPADPSPTKAAVLLKEYFPDADSLIWWPDKPPGAPLVRRRPYIR